MPCHRNRLLLPLQSWPANDVSIILILALIRVEICRTLKFPRDPQCSLRLLRGFSIWQKVRPFGANSVSKGQPISKVALPISVKSLTLSLIRGSTEEPADENKRFSEEE